MTSSLELPSIEVAKTQPVEYKRQLFSLIEKERPGVYRAWTVLKEKGYVDEDNVVLDTDTYQGERSGSLITLGLQPIPEERKYRIFEAEAFTDNDIILYKFSHELSHRLVDMLIGDRSTFSDIPKSLLHVLTTFKQIRELGFGFTNRLNLDNEANMEQVDVMKKRAEEDLVDYVTMFLWDEDYLERYLNYLTDPNSSTSRLVQKQMTMSVQMREYFGRIKTLVSTHLS